MVVKADAMRRDPTWVLVGLLLAFILFFGTAFGAIGLVKVAISGTSMVKDSTTTHQDGIDEKPDAVTRTNPFRYEDLV